MPFPRVEGDAFSPSTVVTCHFPVEFVHYSPIKGTCPSRTHFELMRGLLLTLSPPLINCALLSTFRMSENHFLNSPT